jgi:hypothetical protein
MLDWTASMTMIASDSSRADVVVSDWRHLRATSRCEMQLLRSKSARARAARVTSTAAPAASGGSWANLDLSTTCSPPTSSPPNLSPRIRIWDACDQFPATIAWWIASRVSPSPASFEAATRCSSGSSAGRATASWLRRNSRNRGW